MRLTSDAAWAPGRVQRFWSRLSRPLRIAGKRTLDAVPTVLGIVVLNFLLLQLAPGDAATAIAAESGAATQEMMDDLRTQFGLNLSVATQLGHYLFDLAHLDLGVSPRFNMPVMQLIMERLPGTLALMSCALVIATALGLSAGVVMANHAGRLPDRVLSFLVLFFYSIPGFWIGLMLIVVFSVHLGWLPSGGAMPAWSSATGLSAVLEKARFMVLPVTSLSLLYIAIYSRITRAAMLEVRSQDFVRTARAKGLRPARISVRHVLRNALIPITTLAGLHIGGILGGAVIIETVFSWPGLGRLAVESIMARDFTVLMGILLLSSLLVILVNIVLDLLHAVLDPRIELH
ncbi:ABC transporter permease [Bordetella genomosp. 12]|uniref:ABC transporter permease n=1 Tax=Bordetella genomosp. 12 TaxID=463035 RepID=A0A261VD15_9BORD|nr:ABC transporter permease [Bordetella genomosp. 12]OZI71661.1 ABC transporter permease [Bordetella genomosp. 12]